MPNGISLFRIDRMSAAATKRFRLDRLTNAQGTFAILAIDHMEALAALISPAKPDEVSPEHLAEVKLSVIGAMRRHATGLLVDPATVLHSQRTEATLGESVGLIVGIEVGDYATARDHPQLLPGWNVQRAAEIGADAVKISWYFDPLADNAAAERFVADVVAEAAVLDIPVFAEPLALVTSPADRRPAILEGVRRFGSLGPDILKIEFPEDVGWNPSVEAWTDACGLVNDASPVPWTLLSAGHDYAVLRTMVTVACKSGAAGFLVGRTVWGGVVAGNETLAVGSAKLAELATAATSARQAG